MPVLADNITHTTSASGKGMSKIQQLDLDQARTGMVLGEHALGRHGQLLLSAGTVLNDRHLQMLRANAVARVAVGTGAEPASPAVPADGDSEEQIAARFRLCDEHHPLIHELRRICRQRAKAPREQHDD